MPDGEDSELFSGERQVGATVDQIRADHVARYQWASTVVKPGERVLDLGCGVGYGASLLYAKGAIVCGLDRSCAAIDFAEHHYPGPFYRRADIAAIIEPGRSPGDYDLVVAFEIIEHLRDPKPVLRFARQHAKRLLLSVPNEDAFPWSRDLMFHYRHYTLQQLRSLLVETGWRIDELFGQNGPHHGLADFDPARARTIVVDAAPVLDARPAQRVSRETSEVVAPSADPAPQPEPEGPHIAIIGLGPSCQDYVELARRHGGRYAAFDEVWAINALGAVLDCDLIVHMDDVRIQELRAASPKGPAQVGAMLQWMRRPDGPPIVTSRAHPDYPRLQAYPLAEVLNEFGHVYFNSTSAFAIALAIYRGARKISCFGLDFTYPNFHHAEQGRACVEFWLGVASQRGVTISIGQNSSLMDACEPGDRRLYGFDGVDVVIAQVEEGKITVELKDRDSLPSAEEIEERYDHIRQHPNPLVRRAEAG